MSMFRGIGECRDALARRLRRPEAFFLILTAALWGCANPSHLYFYQTTVIGIDVAVSPQTKNAKVDIGYDRQTNAVIPATEIDSASSPGQKEREAMSVVGTTYVDIGWFGDQKISENLATGTAAQKVAESPLGIAKLFQKPGGEQKTP